MEEGGVELTRKRDITLGNSILFKSVLTGIRSTWVRRHHWPKIEKLCLDHFVDNSHGCGIDVMYQNIVAVDCFDVLDSERVKPCAVDQLYTRRSAFACDSIAAASGHNPGEKNVFQMEEGGVERIPVEAWH